MVEFLSKETQDTEKLAAELAKKLQPGSIIGLRGTLGAGKTVFTRGLARGLGIEGPVTSPTYTLVSEYLNGRLPLYHFDLYRIHSEEEFELIGAREMLYGNGISVIEWFERVEAILPEEMLVITLEINENGSRTIQYSRDI